MSAAYVCFSLAGLIALGMWRYSQTDDEPMPEPVKVPGTTTIIEHRPVLRNGERVLVQVGLQHLPTRPAEQLIPLVREQVSLWALSLKKPDDALCKEEYAKLRSFLHFEGVRSASVVIAPTSKKDQTLSPIEELEKDVAFHQEMENIRQKYSGSTIEDIIERRIKAMKRHILDPNAQ
jgi:hypothetical protein